MTQNKIINTMPHPIFIEDGGRNITVEAKILNLTPHAVVIQDVDGRRVYIPPSGQVARVESEERMVGTAPLDGVTVPVYARHLKTITGLPDSDEPCIVSSLVLEAVRTQQPWRRNVYAPDTGSTAIRDTEGRLVAVRNLIIVQP